ncbi:hypothetical protein [Mycobacterium haemophilum]|uniref:Uncharacterized protein n=1 Tax=Mycobacterium haemophilum TaxID=29311 RepID=A0A0I9TXS1_9MYCO|nr:hypothetical protein [Mycobacterium haemophilum]KLO33400.1 hypothetical protein ABH39_00615 [Mycobacterium haemophilum]KLO38923.1 hypothetical protein ABH38_00615 [Mycobacterium haemophilum]KLO45341.1 hypothetical protein ABH37_00615 [Mycobacterium haemophilum]KLO56490.1 hypothetical protein ABH36_00615 [Mycobacterium haemophilum]
MRRPAQTDRLAAAYAIAGQAITTVVPKEASSLAVRGVGVGVVESRVNGTAGDSVTASSYAGLA